MTLKNKIVIVTGGAGLLGKFFVESIVEQNGIAIIADLNKKEGENLARRLNENQKDKALFVELDITSKESIKQLIDKVDRIYGKIDAVVNNAYPRNKNYGRHFFDVDYADFCENININLGGYFLVSQVFAEYFLKQGYGNIVNIASIYGVVAPRFEIYEGTQMTVPVEYAAIKSGLIHLTKYMAKYFKGKNIKVNTISLGGIEDKQPESFLKNYKTHCLNKGMLEPQDIAGSLLFLLSEQSKYINGQNIIVDDGFTL
jgi:NAD(P)-dependent dehydrogenase (short-subunit alcohol dehydrogenase family)